MIDIKMKALLEEEQPDGGDLCRASGPQSAHSALVVVHAAVAAGS